MNKMLSKLVSEVRVMNLDPNFYTHLNEKSRKEDMETGDAENFVSEERVD